MLWRFPFACALLVACAGEVGSGSSVDGDDVGVDDDEPGDEGGEGGRGGVFGLGGRGGSGAGGGDVTPKRAVAACQGLGPIKAGATAPLARLTNRQYANTLRDLFPGVTLAAVELPAEQAVDGFTNNAFGQNPSRALIEGFETGAKAAAAAAVGALDKVLPCSPKSAAEEEACGKTFIARFGRRAFRRPLSADETTRLESFFAAARTAGGFPSAVRATIERTLQSPQFLYRPEVGKPVAGQKVAQLTGHELAARLSYFLWDTTPDAALDAAADEGALDDLAGLERQAARLLGDPRAHGAVASFSEQWLRLAKLEKIAPSATLFPKFAPETATALRAETRQFADSVFWDRGTLAALLTDTHAWVSKTTAWIYGVPEPAAPTWTELPADRRSGILTQAGIMAAFAKAANDAPVLRGIWVRERFLCSEIPPAPANVNTQLPEPKPGEMPRTTRAIVEQSHSKPGCVECHQYIDPIGFGFGHYDAVGAWRDKENGRPIDARGNIRDVEEGIDGDFDGAIELGAKLARADRVASCAVEHWFRFAFGRSETDADACTVAQLEDAFEASGGDMKKLLVEIVRSDAFRYRATP